MADPEIKKGEGARSKQQIHELFIRTRHLGRFGAFSVIVSRTKVQSTAADCSGMVCSGLSVFGNSIVRLATVTGVSSVSSERGGARQARHYMDPPLGENSRMALCCQNRRHWRRYGLHISASISVHSALVTVLGLLKKKKTKKKELVRKRVCCLATYFYV